MLNFTHRCHYYWQLLLSKFAESQNRFQLGAHASKRTTGLRTKTYCLLLLSDIYCIPGVVEYTHTLHNTRTLIQYYKPISQMINKFTQTNVLFFNLKVCLTAIQSTLIQDATFQTWTFLTLCYNFHQQKMVKCIHSIMWHKS